MHSTAKARFSFCPLAFIWLPEAGILDRVLAHRDMRERLSDMNSTVPERAFCFYLSNICSRNSFRPFLVFLVRSSSSVHHSTLLMPVALNLDNPLPVYGLLPMSSSRYNCNALLFFGCLNFVKAYENVFCLCSSRAPYIGKCGLPDRHTSTVSDIDRAGR